MAPSIHPPCTPSSSCAPPRCHPMLPECSRPEKCLKTTIKKGTRPCQSAASIMATRSTASCGYCKKFSTYDKRGKRTDSSDPRSYKRIQRYLKIKSKEARLRKKDRLRGTHKYLKYQRKKGKVRAKNECCAGKGHRGRLRRPCCRRCCAKCCSYGCRRCCLQCCDECCCPCCGTYCSRYCTIL